MFKYYKRKTMEILETYQSSDQDRAVSRQKVIQVDPESLPADPGLRPSIWSYDVNERDHVRREYLKKGPCQPKSHDFPQTFDGEKWRRFGVRWFEKHATWLEYSIAKDKAFCLCCYLFKPQSKKGGGESFVIGTGFQTWGKKVRLDLHVGNNDSSHNNCKKKCEDLMNQHLTSSISSLYTAKKKQDRVHYRIRLGAAVDCIRFLLRQGLALRGHDESESSGNKGNYLELYHFLAGHNKEIHDVSFKNAPQNSQLVCSDIQKDISIDAAAETTLAMIKDIGDAHFAILVDESRDESFKEQMVVVLRYVNKEGKIVERFLGIEHVPNTTSASLKDSIDKLFSRHNLSISKLRGQGYDGASNMRGQLNGLKTRILEENSSAFYVHCFAHQLQLGLVALAESHIEVQKIFKVSKEVQNVVGASAKRQDILKATQYEEVMEALKKGEIVSGRGLNQETNLQRPGNTRWSSHYASLLRLTTMFSSVVKVLKLIEKDPTYTDSRVDASDLLLSLNLFNVAFTLHLMKEVLGITNELSLALQRREQEIENAMTLVDVARQRLQNMRDNGWDKLLGEVSDFCLKHHIVVLDMLDVYVAPGRSRRGTETKTNMVYFRIELFIVVVDKQLVELNTRFSETSTTLLRFVRCLNPRDSFLAFNIESLVGLARLYPEEFSTYDLLLLSNQLETYILDVTSHREFVALDGIADLAKKMVKTKKHEVYPLVYMLITLALILPVATASVERAFSAMKIVKNRMRTRMGDAYLNACLVTYIEKDVFAGIENEDIMQRFQTMSPRREQL